MQLCVDVYYSSVGTGLRTNLVVPVQVEDYAEELKQAGVEKTLEEVEDTKLKYPDYYLSKFHVRPSASKSLI